MGVPSKSFDVVVIGGGIAGVAAAIQAVRSGCKTALVEKTVLWGGLATTGLVNIYLPLCDGYGTQVSYGLCEELIQHCNDFGPGSIPTTWKKERGATHDAKRYRTDFSPASYILSLDQMISEAGVEPWLDTVVTGARLSQGRISALTVENESGTVLLKAKRFVDASGSAVLARRLGMKIHTTANYRSIWVYETNKGKMLMHYGPIGDHANVSDCYSDDVLKAAGYTRKSLSKVVIKGISGKIVSDFIMGTRRCVREFYRECYEKKGESRSEHFPVKLPAMHQLRMIAAIDAPTMMKDGGEWTTAKDSVGMVADWRKSGYVWEVPYSSLYAKDGPSNLLFAGRCIGAIGDAWDVMRVIPCAAVTGQAAGLAAAISLKKRVQPNVLPYGALEKEFRKLSIPLHFEDLGIKRPC